MENECQIYYGIIVICELIRQYTCYEITLLPTSVTVTCYDVHGLIYQIVWWSYMTDEQYKTNRERNEEYVV